MDTALKETEAEIVAAPVPARDGRICPRAVTRPVSPYPGRNTHDGPISQHADYTITTAPPGQATRTSSHQPQHPANTTSQPP
jgi:hypothetical protein